MQERVEGGGERIEREGEGGADNAAWESWVSGKSSKGEDETNGRRRRRVCVLSRPLFEKI